jgi:hypothetical protein
MKNLVLLTEIRDGKRLDKNTKKTIMSISKDILSDEEYKRMIERKIGRPCDGCNE